MIHSLSHKKRIYGTKFTYIVSIWNKVYLYSKHNYMERLFVKYHLCLWIIVVVLFLVKELEGCLEKEKLGLLDLKTFLISNSTSKYNNLTSWDDNSDVDCCSWERVKCNHTTGHVMDLLLGGVTIPTNTTYLWVFNFSYFLPFNHLVHLDLSNNYLDGWVEIEGNFILVFFF